MPWMEDQQVLVARHNEADLGSESHLQIFVVFRIPPIRHGSRCHKPSVPEMSWSSTSAPARYRAHDQQHIGMAWQVMARSREQPALNFPEEYCMIVDTILADTEYNPRANFRRAARCSEYIRQRNSQIEATSLTATRSALPRPAGDEEPSPGGHTARGRVRACRRGRSVRTAEGRSFHLRVLLRSPEPLSLPHLSSKAPPNGPSICMASRIFLSTR